MTYRTYFWIWRLARSQTFTGSGWRDLNDEFIERVVDKRVNIQIVTLI